jgi:hypothetical protein
MTISIVALEIDRIDIYEREGKRNVASDGDIPKLRRPAIFWASCLVRFPVGYRTGLYSRHIRGR